MTDFVNNAREVSTTSGAADFVVSGVVFNGIAFASALTDGEESGYIARYSDGTTAGYEVGRGVWTAGTSTLARTTIEDSSNGGARVVFTAASKNIEIVLTAAQLAPLEAAALKPNLHKEVTIIDPEESDDATLFFTPVAITVTDVRPHITGGDFSKVNGDVSGRKTVVAQQASMSITLSGTATHVVIDDGTDRHVTTRDHMYLNCTHFGRYSNRTGMRYRIGRPSLMSLLFVTGADVAFNFTLYEKSSVSGLLTPLSISASAMVKARLVAPDSSVPYSAEVILNDDHEDSDWISGDVVAIFDDSVSGAVTTYGRAAVQILVDDGGKIPFVFGGVQVVQGQIT